MNRATAMQGLAHDLGVSNAMPPSITSLVAQMGGTRAVAELLPTSYNRKGQPVSIQNKQRTIQRYLLAEKGETGERARGTSSKARARTLADLHSGAAQAEANKAFPAGFTATVKGNFVVSEYSQPGRQVRAVDIDKAGMDTIVDQLARGEWEQAAIAFEKAYGPAYDPSGALDNMHWGEGATDPDAFDKLVVS